LQCKHSLVRRLNPVTNFTVPSETPPTWRARSPYLYPPGTGWPSYTPRALTPWPESASERYRPSYRRLSAKLVPTFADRGCRVVGTTDPLGRIFGFLDRKLHIFTEQHLEYHSMFYRNVQIIDDEKKSYNRSLPERKKQEIVRRKCKI
jgi:hypothetical protein